jgi:hypothetical protein
MYNPHPKRLKDWLSGECWLSIFIMTMIVTNTAGYVLNLLGYDIGGLLYAGI